MRREPLHPSKAQSATLVRLTRQVAALQERTSKVGDPDMLVTSGFVRYATAATVNPPSMLADSVDLVAKAGTCDPDRWISHVY